ncbi:hypothetical protein D3C87_1710110 [compost metagenome]
MFLVHHLKKVGTGYVRASCVAFALNTSNFSCMTSFFLIFDNRKDITKLWQLFKSCYRYWRRWASALKRLTGKIKERTDFTIGCPSH